jgi:hypothetical protein
LGVSVQNFTQLGGHAGFLHPFNWSLVSGLKRFLTDDQKQQYVSVCKVLCQITSNDATFLSRVKTCDKNWIYGYDQDKATILPREGCSSFSWTPRGFFTKTASQFHILLWHFTATA